MTTVYVVFSTIQHKWERERYTEIEGVAFTESGARKLEEDAKKRSEVLYTDTEIHYPEDEE